MKLPSYKNPPVVEVIMGVQFNNKMNIRTLDFADFWARLGRDVFGRYQEAPPLDPIIIQQQNTINFEFASTPPSPRYIFVNEDVSALVQVQRDRFLYNWKKLKDGEYPRYKNILPEFMGYYAVLDEFYKAKSKEILEPAILELTYVNIIDIHDEDKFSVDSILKDFSWITSKRYLKYPKHFQQTLVFDIVEIQSSMTVVAERVEMIETGESKLKLELSVRGPALGSDLKGNIKWFDMARENIVNGFTDLTTKGSHDIWGRE